MPLWRRSDSLIGLSREAVADQWNALPHPPQATAPASDRNEQDLPPCDEQAPLLQCDHPRVRCSPQLIAPIRFAYPSEAAIRWVTFGAPSTWYRLTRSCSSRSAWVTLSC